MIESPQAEPDYYAVLGVASDATPAEIEQAYRQEAGRRLNARWRPERAARELALLNAAYGILGYPDRRADYDGRRANALTAPDGVHPADRLVADGHAPVARPVGQLGRPHLPRVQLGRPTGGSPADAVIIVLVVLFALFIASVLASRSLVDLSFALCVCDALGISRRRPAPPQNPVVVAAPPEAKPSPAPTPVPTPAEPPPGALPTALTAQRFAGSQVVLSSERPARQADLTVTLKLMREGQPVPDANVYLVAHYSTVDERQPAGTATVKTDASGTAAITFNVGDAIANRDVNLVVTALVDGQQVVFKTTFTPRP
jgi:hypothetical protein